MDKHLGIDDEQRSAPVGRTPLLSIRGLRKSFGGSPALAGVDLTILPGEVHGLLGENGSGKSTLIKILAGYHAPDEGTITVHGTPVGLPLHPGAYRQLGFAFVHQDLALIPSLSVTENLFIERFATTRGAWISWRKEHRRARELCRSFGLDIDASTPVGELEPIERAMLAIIRAVQEIGRGEVSDAAQAHLLVLDEPTVFLPEEQVAQLFSLMRRVASSGSSVLFVSHDLGEVRQVTDRVTVLRDGKVAGTIVTKDTDISTLITLILGRELAQEATSMRRVESQGSDLLRVSDLTTPLLNEISLDAHEGEIVGLTGLLGSGHEDLPYALFGALPDCKGHMVLGGEECDLGSMSPARAIGLGMALVPADRRKDGAVGSLSVAHNITSVTLDQYFKGLRLRFHLMQDAAAKLSDEFDIRPRDVTLDYILLSGGNQQKALLAKWLQLKPRLLLLHEPTQGVDVGARQQIFELLRSARKDRVVLCSSADHEQLAMICDRVLIFAKGRLSSVLSGSAVTQDNITERCLRSTAIAAEVTP